MLKNTFKKHLDLLLIEKKSKIAMLLLKILINLFMVIYYIVEKSIFVVIVYKLLEQKKY